MAVTADLTPRRRGSSPAFRRALPYLLSMPALLVCVAVLIPFVTAVFYSLERYRLSQPYLKGFIWFGNYVAFFHDSEFWNTVWISLLYTVLTVVCQLLLGLGMAMLLRQRSRANNFISVMLLLPLMTAPAIAALMWKLMTNPNFGVLSYLVGFIGLQRFPLGVEPLLGSVHGGAGRHLGLHAVHHDPAAGRAALPAPTALRGRGARRRAFEFRLLPHHLADADPLHHHGGAVPVARLHPAVRHHLCDRPRAAPATS